MNKIAFTFALVTALTAASSSALAQFGVGEATVNVTAQPNEVQNLVITKQRDLYLGDIIYNVIDSNSPAVYGVGHSYVFNRRNLLCGSSYIINNNINVYNRRSGSAAEVLFEGDAESLVQLSFSNIEDQATDPYIVLTGEIRHRI